jgi:hypothetical protein
MKSRSFVKATIISGSISGLAPLASLALPKNDGQAAPLEFYELRTYILKNEAQQRLVENYFANAAIPALNRLGASNVGVFTELKPSGQSRVFVLIPFKSLEDFLTVQDNLANDAGYVSAAADYLEAPATAPAYERIESSLLRAFIHMPAIQVPPKNSRIFELRRYESPGETTGKKKIEMFNSAGEIEIFKRVGLQPVFFGETLIGPSRPNLTYMLTFDDMAEHDRNWKAFGGDPEWKKISTKPEYADAKILSNITATFLVPTAFSQI